MGNEFEVGRGKPLPLGTVILPEGINFAVFSRRATAVQLVLFPEDDSGAVQEISLDPSRHRSGDVWHILLLGAKPGIRYGYRMDRQPNSSPQLDRFDPAKILIDPYCRALSPGPMKQRRCLAIDSSFPWRDGRRLEIHPAETIIYELHVRGFTQHPSSGVEYPGTYRGLTEKIPYLKDLGITAVELMPVAEFDERGNPRSDPESGKPLSNFWGYDPLAFFAPKASYSSDPREGGQVREFQQMVQAFHEAGIEVILDVVFNHTGEWGEDGFSYSFKGIDNQAYYLTDPQSGRYHDFSGCGNTVNCNQPAVRDLIVDCLRYWVTEMQVDGFRFDQASILARGSNGEPLKSPPLLERIAADPVLAGTKLIAEAWDAAGLYQVGSFPDWGRWAEWNGKFRDDLRRFVKGDPGMTSALASRLSGSPDLYRDSGRPPFHSINFITCHDGFTLADLVSFNQKHNLSNGEGNRDGSDCNHSWNCGEEGSTSSAQVLALRRRQVRNLATLMMLSQGVPMVLAGDEMGRTQQGNNNAYCHDNQISWIDWSLLHENQGLHRFFRLLIGFRKSCPLLRSRSYAGGDEAAWHGVQLDQPDFSSRSQCLAMHLKSPHCGREIHLIAHAGPQSRAFELPVPQQSRQWHRFIDTSLQSPLDICEDGSLSQLEDQCLYAAEPFSTVVLIGE